MSPPARARRREMCEQVSASKAGWRCVSGPPLRSAHCRAVALLAPRAGDCKGRGATPLAPRSALPRCARTEDISRPPCGDAPAVYVIRVAPHQVAHRPLVRRLLHALQLADLLERVERRREAAVHAAEARAGGHGRGRARRRGFVSSPTRGQLRAGPALRCCCRGRAATTRVLTAAPGGSRLAAPAARAARARCRRRCSAVRALTGTGLRRRRRGRGSRTCLCRDARRALTRICAST